MEYKANNYEAMFDEDGYMIEPKRDENGNPICNHWDGMLMTNGNCAYCEAIINLPFSIAYWRSVGVDIGPDFDRQSNTWKW